MAAENRAILVTDIPERCSKESIKTYFQRESNGGGEIDRVIHPFRSNPAEAMVIFKHVESAKSVLRQSHCIGNYGVKVRQVEPEVFGLVTAVILPGVCEQLSRFECFHTFLGDFKKGAKSQDVYTTNDGLFLRGGWYQVQNARRALQNMVQDGTNRSRVKASISQEETAIHRPFSQIPVSNFHDNIDIAPVHKRNDIIGENPCDTPDGDLTKMMKGMSLDSRTQHPNRDRVTKDSEQKTNSKESLNAPSARSAPSQTSTVRTPHFKSSEGSINPVVEQLTIPASNDAHMSPNATTNSVIPSTRCDTNPDLNETPIRNAEMNGAPPESNNDNMDAENKNVFEIDLEGTADYRLAEYAFTFGKIDDIQKEYYVACELVEKRIIIVPILDEEKSQIAMHTVKQLLKDLKSSVVTDTVDTDLSVYPQGSKEQAIETTVTKYRKVIIRQESGGFVSITGPPVFVKTAKSALKLGLGISESNTPELTDEDRILQDYLRSDSDDDKSNYSESSSTSSKSSRITFSVGKNLKCHKVGKGHSLKMDTDIFKYMYHIKRIELEDKLGKHSHISVEAPKCGDAQVRIVSKSQSERKAVVDYLQKSNNRYAQYKMSIPLDSKMLDYDLVENIVRNAISENKKCLFVNNRYPDDLVVVGKKDVADNLKKAIEDCIPANRKSRNHKVAEDRTVGTSQHSTGKKNSKDVSVSQYAKHPSVPDNVIPDTTAELKTETKHTAFCNVDSDTYSYIQKVQKDTYEKLSFDCDIRAVIKDETTDVTVSCLNKERAEKVANGICKLTQKEKLQIKKAFIDCGQIPLNVLEVYIVSNEFQNTFVRIGKDSKTIVVIGKDDKELEVKCRIMKDLHIEISSTRHGSRHSRSQNDLNSKSSYSHEKSSSTFPGNTNYSYKTPYRYATREGLNVLIYTGDITKASVSAITNAANGGLSHGGGVAWAISNAAGHKFQQESYALISRRHLNVTEVIKQYSEKLSRHGCMSVIHAVGPSWRNYKQKDVCSSHLKQTFLNVMKLADTNECEARSLAMPLISSGVYGVPKDICARMLFEAVIDFSSHPRRIKIVQEIHLVNNEERTTQIIVDTFKSGTSFHSSPSHADASSYANVVHATQRNAEYNPEPMETDQDQPIHTAVCSRCQGHPAFNYGRECAHTLCTECQHTYAHYPNIQPIAKKLNNPSTSTKTDNFKPFIPDRKATTSANASLSKKDPEQEVCPICSDEKVSRKLDKCGHKFCSDCIDQWFKQKPVCPICGEIYGVLTGTQPRDGTMKITRDNLLGLHGYGRYGAIIIDYEFRGGVQGLEHPNPGKRYSGTRRIAYLPDNTEGREILHLLQQAFDNRMVFTIGRSTTTGLEDKITWNDIHHKTSSHGGPAKFGYPDAGYLARVKEELAAKGIK